MWFFGKKKKAKVVNKEIVKPVVVEDVVVPKKAFESTNEIVVEEVIVPEVAPEIIVESKPKPDSVGGLFEVKAHKVEGWQVIKQGGSRANRRFPTQTECETFCEENGLDYVIVE